MKIPTMRFFAADNGGASASPVSSESSAAASAPGGEGGAPTAADAKPPEGGGEPSAPQQAEKQPTALEVAKSALGESGASGSAPEAKPGEQKPPVSSQPAAQQPTPGAPKVEQPPAQLSEKEQAEADKALPFHDHPRFQQVIRERREALQQAEGFKPDAEEQRTIQKFMADNDIPASEVANALHILAALRNDPAKAREMLSEIWGKLDEFTGHKLPADLQKKVDDGVLDAETARELAASRASTAFSNQRGQEREQKSQQQQQQEAHQQAVQAVGQATMAWEQQKRTSDPDYAKVEPFVKREAAAIILQKGPAKTASAAVKLLEEAYENAKKSLQGFTPTRQPTAKRPESGSSIPAAAKQPTTSLEVARQALEQT